MWKQHWEINTKSMILQNKQTTHVLRLPSMSAWLLRVRMPCLYVVAFSKSGMAMKGLLPSVTLTTLFPPTSHCSSTSSDRLFLNSSSSLQKQSGLTSINARVQVLRTYTQISPRSHMIMQAHLTPGDDIGYSHRPLQLLILY